jgi:hypothetical protein
MTPRTNGRTRAGKFRGKRWQGNRKPFHITDLYLDELRRLLREHAGLSRNARAVGLAVCDEFARHRKHKGRPMVHPGMDALADACGVDRQTVTRALRKLQAWGLLSFYVPMYNKRKGGREGATEIYFPVKPVTESLRMKGVLRTRRLAKNTSKNKAVPKVVGHFSEKCPTKKSIKPGISSDFGAAFSRPNAPSFQDARGDGATPAPTRFGTLDASATGVGARAPRDPAQDTTPPKQETAWSKSDDNHDDSWMTGRTNVPQIYRVGSRWQLANGDVVTVRGYRANCIAPNVLTELENGWPWWCSPIDLKQPAPTAAQDNQQRVF